MVTIKLIIGFLFNFFGNTSVIYLKETKNVFYADAPSKWVTIRCSPEHPEDKNSFTYVEVLGKKRIDIFIYRRPWPYESCLHNKVQMKKILFSNSRVKVIGSSKLSTKINFQDKDLDDNGNVLKNPKGLTAHFWIFESIHAGKECYSYFENTCEGDPFKYILSYFTNP